MPESLIAALVQAPFVLVMLYMVQRFLTHLKEREHEWQAFMNRADTALAAHLAELAEAVDRLSVVVLYHDATVRGVNPQTLGSTDDLLHILRDGR
jgi:hypothetical protein